MTPATENASMPARVVTVVYLFAAAVLLGALAYNHYQVLHYPYPLDYNEAAVPTVTATLVEGGNPFALENQPARTSVYPIMINLVVAPLTLVFGNTIFLHRLVSLLLIAASSLLVGAILFRQTRSIAASFVATVFAYAGFIYYSTPIAGPNGLSLLLFLATVALPWLRDFSRGSLAVAIVLGVLAFYTKQYFMAGLGYVALYLFLARSKKAGVLFGLAFTAALLASIPVAMVLTPYYFDSTFFPLFPSVAEIGSADVMTRQVREYSAFVYPFYLVLALYLGRHAWSARAARRRGAEDATPPGNWFNLTDLDAPLLPRGVDYFLVCLLCSVFLFVTVLGTNPGNHLSYLFQLVSPFLVIVVLGLMGRMGRLALVCQLLLLPAMYHAFDMQSRDFSVRHAQNWPQLQRIIDGSDQVFVSNILLERVLASGKEIHQNGHTPYFVFALYKPALFRRDDPAVSVEGIWERYVQRIHGMIRRREFDALLLDVWTPLPGMPPGSDYSVSGRELLERYYEKTRKLPVSAAKRPGGGAFGIEVWRPRAGDIPPG